jgi:hypothetical protein
MNRFLNEVLMNYCTNFLPRGELDSAFNKNLLQKKDFILKMNFLLKTAPTPLSGGAGGGFDNHLLKIITF